MLTRTSPQSTIVVDASAQDTGHRTRGIGRYAGELWKALSRLDDNIVALRMTDANRSWSADMPNRHLLRFVQAQHGLAGELERAGCTVFGATEPWMLPRTTKKLRVVPTCHDVIPLEFAKHYGGWDNAKWAVYFRWLRSSRALDDCARIIAPSEATRDALAEYMAVDPDRVTVIPHGIDHERFFAPSDAAIDAVRASLGIGSERYALYVGGYDYRKNVVRLVEAFGASGKHREWLLVLAGPASVEERSAVLDAAQRAGVMNRIVWAGRVPEEELRGLYGGAEVFVYPSLSEGFGLQVLEAMACGCAVITSNCSALREVAAPAAKLVDPHRVDAIAAAIASLDEAECEELRLAGLEHVKRFDWATTARATLAVYQAAALD